MNQPAMPPTYPQEDGALMVVATLGGTTFRGDDGSMLVLVPDADYVISIDREGNTSSAAVGDWSTGYDA